MPEKLTLNKSIFVDLLRELHNSSDLNGIRSKVDHLLSEFDNSSDTEFNFFTSEDNGNALTISRTYLLSELTQIKNTQTLERTRYYLNRLIKGITETKTGTVNDINLNRWKEYENILTDSLWVLPKRDSSGAHSSWYWGNFIPQIPHQLLLRYTKANEVVIDPFVGSGTTLLECQRLGRHGIGVELNKEIADRTRDIVQKGIGMSIENNSTTIIENGDSTRIDFKKLLERNGFSSAQLLVLHPPYHDIIKFGDDPNDLSAQDSVDTFLELFGKVIDKTYPVLDPGRYMAVVIGDKYAKGDWIPLGFYTMQEVLKRNYSLKSIIVKNFEETLAKRNQKELWRYRALAGGFYIFKHEYIFLFRKK